MGKRRGGGAGRRLATCRHSLLPLPRGALGSADPDAGDGGGGVSGEGGGLYAAELHASSRTWGRTVLLLVPEGVR